MLAAFLFAATGTADAGWEGTAGKVAYLTSDGQTTGLRLWDPVTEASRTIEAVTWEAGNQGTYDGEDGPVTATAGDVPSAPSWSPDGSRFAYSKMIDDPGDFAGLKHSAIFVYRVATGQTTQVTTPQKSLVDKTPRDDVQTGHVVADFSPTFSADGDTIAFVRRIETFGSKDLLVGQNGQNLWRTAATGGGATQLTRFTQDKFTRIATAVWIPHSQSVMVGYLDPDGSAVLARASSGGGAPTPVAGAPFGDAITDYDLSPDGKKLAFNTFGAGGITQFVQPLDGGPAVATGTNTGPILRFSGSGDGLLHGGCTTRTVSVCGLLDELLPDADADIDHDEPDRLVLAFDIGVPGAGGNPARMGFDIQPQTLPVIFLPGFLGTTISCAGKEEWPSLPFPDLLPMSLNADGVTDNGCRPGAVLERANVLGPIGTDVYATVARYVRDTFGARGTLFGWDWRKRPRPSFAELETAIDDALARPGPWEDQQANRVVLWGHSYGGLFIREFIAGSGGDRVARVLTVGTPYWGSPKPFFPLAFGVEAPGLSAMDVFIGNDRLQQFAQNLTGLYNLYPSSNYPPWLSVDGVLQNQAGVSSFLGRIGGNTGLFNQALADHQNLFDGFYDNDNRIDVRAVVGTGLNTIRSVDVQYGDDGAFTDVSGTFDNGDETVPGRSAAQGPVGGGNAAALGDRIHIQYTCNVDHGALPGAPRVLTSYENFLTTGEVPRKLPPPCSSAGGSYRFAPGSIGRTAPEERAAARTTRAAGESLDLDTAEQQGLVDILDLGPATLAVVNDARPVTLTVPIVDGTFSYTPLAGADAGPVTRYGPATGVLELAPGAAGQPPVVLLDGAPLGPSETPPVGVPGPVGPAPQPAPPGAGAVTPSPPAAARMKLVGRPRLRGRTVTLVLALPGRGALVVRGSAKVGARSRTFATRRIAIRAAANRRKVTMKFKRKPPAKLRLAIAFTPTGGEKQTQTVTVKRARRR